MALLGSGSLCCSSTSPFSFKCYLCPKLLSPTSPHLSLSLSSLSHHRFSIETRRRRAGPFVVSASSTPSATIQSPSLEEDAQAQASGNRLCAQNIPWTCTADDIRALFEKHGTVLDVELSMHNKIRNRGLAFITMGSFEEALTALKNLDASDFEGRYLKVNYAHPRKKMVLAPRKRALRYDLFVANLAYEAEEEDLKEFFDAGSGNVVSAEVVFHENPKMPSGHGFVTYSSFAEAEAALSAFQGKMFMGRPIKVAHSRRVIRRNPRLSTKSNYASSELNS